MVTDWNEAFWQGFLGEFFKLSSLSPEELQRSIERVEELEKGVDHEQLKRYAGMGAVVSPLASTLEKVVAGDPILHREAGKVKWGRSGRQQVGKMVGGAIGGGLLPIARHHLDRAAERHLLRKRIEEYEKSLQEAPANDTTDLPQVPVTKVATSLIPASHGSPRSRLRSAKRVGADDGSANITDRGGPSISQVSKPRGFGVPLPGTVKPSSGV